VPFGTDIELRGPLRRPAQMLAAQSVGGHASIHDEATAAALGVAGAPIEGPTHFSQFEPLATAVWGTRWFTSGCLSSHFRAMVTEGEEVQASLTVAMGAGHAAIRAEKQDGTVVLEGTASAGPAQEPTELARRLAALRAPGKLHIIDQLRVGMREEVGVASVTFDEPNGAGYPFTLREKLDRITELHPWWTPEGGPGSPWGAAILPMEMVSVLANKTPRNWPIRQPSIGLFLDLEIRMLDGPVLVGRPYEVASEIVGISESRRTESWWTRTTLTDAETGRPCCEVLLHQGLFKDSYPGYPASQARG
jgi:hypothetical protein